MNQEIVQEEGYGSSIEADRALGMTVDRLRSEIKCEAINYHYAERELKLINGRIASIGMRYPELMDSFNHNRVLTAMTELELDMEKAHRKIETFIKTQLDDMIKEVMEVEKKAGGKDAT